MMIATTMNAALQRLGQKHWIALFSLRWRRAEVFPIFDEGAFVRWTSPGQVLTNDLYGDPSTRRRQTTAPKQPQQGSIPQEVSFDCNDFK
jgi:hypothetical protein